MIKSSGNRTKATLILLMGVASALSAATGCTMWSKPSAGYAAAAKEPSPKADAVAEVYPRNEIPAYVGQITAVRVYSTYEKIDTGVDLTPGRLYSIMAKGRVFLEPTDPGRTPSDRRFVKVIGKGPQTPVFVNEVGDTFVSTGSGRLSLGFMDQDFRDNLGYFDAIIISWQTDDYAQVAEFLQKIHERYPDHPGITQAYMRADKVRDLTAARMQTAMEIDQTKEKIQALQRPGQSKGGPTPQERLQQQRELEYKLAELTARLAQLDRLNQQLQIEKARSVQLSQELEKERRERERMSKIAAEGKAPPLLLITSPEDGQRVEVGSVRLTGAVEGKQGLKSLDIFLNNRPLEGSGERGIRQVGDKAPHRLNFDRKIQLEEGLNLLRVVATDVDDLVSEKSISVQYQLKRRNVWAVVIGINDYPRLPKLKFAVNDAEAFYRLLVEENRVPPENVTLLTNEQASLVNLRSTLGTRIKNAARENDMVIIFFAGHGATERDAASPDGDGLEKYLLPYDTDPADLYTTAMPMVEVARILNRIRSERLVFLADACYSGGSGGRTISVSGIRANIADSFLERVAGGRGKVIITASSANEVSVEKEELQHGVFTYYLLEGLRGKADLDRDGMITVDEAYRYVYEQVPAATGQEQHPVRKGSVEGNLVLSIVR
ncbi:MAG: caspase family protein [Hyphomicrobiales bacterium]